MAVCAEGDAAVWNPCDRSGAGGDDVPLHRSVFTHGYRYDERAQEQNGDGSHLQHAADSLYRALEYYSTKRSRSDPKFILRCRLEDFAVRFRSWMNLRWGRATGLRSWV